jgi:hypothetical protein
MRSSKSRSRSKSNRPRTLGNITNRVFDSSGPEGKVRGTPQQIIEKYLFLARDAQLSNDRVAAENFLQHAEHYTRMLGEAQREMAAEQEQRRQQENQNQPRERFERNDQQDGRSDSNQDQRGNRNDGRNEARGDYRSDERRDENRGENRNEARNENRRDWRSNDQRDEPAQPSTAVIDGGSSDDDNGLVETPEARPSRPKGGERRPKPATVAPMVPVAEMQGGLDLTVPTETEEKPAKPRRPRGPRKPRQAESDESSGDPQEAAE